MADDASPELPVAEPWFVRRRVSEGLTLITEPHVHPLLRCNVWHVRGRDRDLVIDTALGLAPLAGLVERELEHQLLAIATHSHTDHVGGFAEFDERAIHRYEAGSLQASSLSTLVSEHFSENVTGPYRDAGYEIPVFLVDAVPTVGLPSLVRDVGSCPRDEAARRR